MPGRRARLRPADLSHWLAASLWAVELDGEIVETRHKIVGARGRLVREIDRYGAAVRELAEAGAWRCRDRDVDALLTEGDAELAYRFAAASTLDDLAALGADVNESTFAGGAAALAADAGHFALHGLPAQAPFVVACSVGHLAAGSQNPAQRPVAMNRSGSTDGSSTSSSAANDENGRVRRSRSPRALAWLIRIRNILVRSDERASKWSMPRMTPRNVS